MAARTPGPWTFSTHPQPNGCPIIGARGLMIAMLTHSINHDDQRETAIANAKLIAAAPELMDALTALVMNIDAGGATLGAMAYARAIIAKVTS